MEFYITGYTAGTLGDASQGDTNAFIINLSNAGNPLWTQQLRQAVTGIAI
jgi:hypothetical protein